MGNLFGKVLAAPARILNIPVRIFEDTLEPFGDKMPENERMLSRPLDCIADGIEKGIKYIINGKDYWI